ncbi:TetR/AcrR family transcriptional regulator [Agrobacterium rubi]|uniref:TetR/AcrR family transcriptional regulator n=1 Tax=Agrobacterium rubi TaxID=28099 RepID=UPI001573AD78|nr:TetR/AcrR family transcriptional regulator [Agrobacterium rubi]NTF06238.1 TetR/AcrR family transcriptional regulator [Agrobacterium rubi]NTF18479.1 TetR/AcrR family transcriptional regulator [Agrobacterium rubi]NTF25443.1 TetR/AcrR family transcriptional regulator [Agrobacterium rubi]
MAIRTRAQMVEETREKLIIAARKAFATKGYAASSMDDITADAGLTRGALYHNFGDKKGLFQAVIDQIDAEMLARLRIVQEGAETRWLGLLSESTAYIEMALEPEIQRVMLLDGPAVLGDPAKWPNQTACLRRIETTVQALVDDGTLKPVDAKAATWLLNGAVLNAALWIAAADDPRAAFPKAVEAFRQMASGLLAER